MADEVDITNERMEQLEQLAIRHRAQVTLAETAVPFFTGNCAFCGEIISVGKFCDKDCRDDYGKEQYMRSQRPW